MYQNSVKILAKNENLENDNQQSENEIEFTYKTRTNEHKSRKSNLTTNNF